MRISRNSLLTGALTTTLASVLLCGQAFATFSATIPVNGTGPVNLRSLANTNGYNGADHANITFEVDNGTTITGNNNDGFFSWSSGAAINTGTWPTSSYTINLSLVVKSGAVVQGGGGNGGDGGAGFPYEAGDWGWPGGDGVHVLSPISITVQSGGIIAVGGTGGKGGDGDDLWVYPWDDYCWGGGGGGGGYPNGQGGAGGDTTSYPYIFGCVPGTPGTAANGSTAGAGGAGATGSPNGTEDGGPGTYDTTGSYGVRKNGHSVSITNNGNIYGGVN